MKAVVFLIIANLCSCSIGIFERLPGDDNFTITDPTGPVPIEIDPNDWVSKTIDVKPAFPNPTEQYTIIYVQGRKDIDIRIKVNGHDRIHTTMASSARLEYRIDLSNVKPGDVAHVTVEFSNGETVHGDVMRVSDLISWWNQYWANAASN